MKVFNDDAMRADAPAVSTSVPGQPNSIQAGQDAEAPVVVSNRRGCKRRRGTAGDDFNIILREVKKQRIEAQKQTTEAQKQTTEARKQTTEARKQTKLLEEMKENQRLMTPTPSPTPSLASQLVRGAAVGAASEMTRGLFEFLRDLVRDLLR
jgi:hypothetical protein